MPRATPSVIPTLRLAARLAEIFPIPAVRSGISILKGQYHVMTLVGMTILVNPRLTLATCHPPPVSVPSSGTVVTNGNSDGLKLTNLPIPGGGQFEPHASLQLHEVAPSPAGLATWHVLCGGAVSGVT